MRVMLAMPFLDEPEGQSPPSCVLQVDLKDLRGKPHVESAVPSAQLHLLCSPSVCNVCSAIMLLLMYVEYCRCLAVVVAIVAAPHPLPCPRFSPTLGINLDQP